MLFHKLVCAALLLMLTASCTSRDSRATSATSSPECKPAAGEDHMLEKVGRTIFWLEIKLAEQSKKNSSRCDTPQE